MLSIKWHNGCNVNMQGFIIHEDCYYVIATFCGVVQLQRRNSIRSATWPFSLLEWLMVSATCWTSMSKGTSSPRETISWSSAQRTCSGSAFQPSLPTLLFSLCVSLTWPVCHSCALHRWPAYPIRRRSFAWSSNRLKMMNIMLSRHTSWESQVSDRALHSWSCIVSCL